MTDVLPSFRSEVSVNVHVEGSETFLILNDPFGFTDGPIMVHSDMVDILERCDGETTFAELAAESDVDVDGAEMMRVKAFVSQLSAMGFLDGDESKQRREQGLLEWHQLQVRPAVCAGSTYPSDPDEFRAFMNSLMYQRSSLYEVLSPKVILLPHIDFRVAPDAYAPGFQAVASSDAELIVMIGTSHYWSEDRVIITDKHFETPIGVVETDREIVNALRSSLPPVQTDLAHKPEHSLELHVVGLKYVLGDRPFKIVPILVTGVGGEHDAGGFAELQEIAGKIHREVTETGKKVLWMISGDLAHVGRKFGDELPATALFADVSDFDQSLLTVMEGSDPSQIHSLIESTQDRFRICGHSPVVLGLLSAVSAVSAVMAEAAVTAVTALDNGIVLNYGMWDEAETQSAVSYATVVWAAH